MAGLDLQFFLGCLSIIGYSASDQAKKFAFTSYLDVN